MIVSEGAGWLGPSSIQRSGYDLKQLWSGTRRSGSFPIFRGMMLKVLPKLSLISSIIAVPAKICDAVASATFSVSWIVIAEFMNNRQMRSGPAFLQRPVVRQGHTVTARTRSLFGRLVFGSLMRLLTLLPSLPCKLQ